MVNERYPLDTLCYPLERWGSWASNHKNPYSQNPLPCLVAVEIIACWLFDRLLIQYSPDADQDVKGYRNLRSSHDKSSKSCEIYSARSFNEILHPCWTRWAWHHEGFESRLAPLVALLATSNNIYRCGGAKPWMNTNRGTKACVGQSIQGRQESTI